MDYQDTMNAAALKYAISVLQDKLDDLEGSFQPRPTPQPQPSAAPHRGRPKGRTLSPEARKAIAEAQKKRWAASRVQQPVYTPPSPEPVEVDPAAVIEETAAPEAPAEEAAPAAPAKRGKKKG